MVVDDDNFTRELISMALRRHGYEVIAANDGLHAIIESAG
jgi:CheY-like chemotaxis protein